MKFFWMVMAGIGIAVAGFFLWRRDLDKAFVAGALGMVAWFLHYRVQMKEIARAAEQEDENSGDEMEEQDDN